MALPLPFPPPPPPDAGAQHSRARQSSITLAAWETTCTNPHYAWGAITGWRTTRLVLGAIRRYMYPFRCHALSLTSVLLQVTHRQRVLVLSGDHRLAGQRLHAVLPRSHSPLRRVKHCDPAQLAPVRARPLKQLAFTSSTPSQSLALTNPFARQRATTLKLCFTPSLGGGPTVRQPRTTGGGCRPAILRVSPLKRTFASTPPSTSSPQVTSVTASTTNGPPLRFLTYVRVTVTTTMTANAPTMMPPNDANTARIHGLETRWRPRRTSQARRSTTRR